MFLGAIVIAALLYYATKDARTDQELARQGIVSPRLQAKYGDEARAKTAQYGFLDYLGDAWSDAWRQRTDARRAAGSAAPSVPGGRVTIRDRLRAVGATLGKVATTIKDHPVTRILVDPVGEKRPVVPAVDPPAVTPAPPAADPDTQPETAAVEDTVVLPTPSKEQPVSQPTGEATNFHAAIAEIDAITGQVRLQLDQAGVALRALDAVDQSIDGMQARQKQIGAAARSLADHLAALNVNPALIAPVAEAADVLDATQADALLQAVEYLRVVLNKVVANCDAALAALSTARSTLIGMFADAANVVQEQLGGDGRFVGSESAHTPAHAAS